MVQFVDFACRNQSKIHVYRKSNIFPMFADMPIFMSIEARKAIRGLCHYGREQKRGSVCSMLLVRITPESFFRNGEAQATSGYEERFTPWCSCASPQNFFFRNGEAQVTSGYIKSPPSHFSTFLVSTLTSSVHRAIVMGSPCERHLRSSSSDISSDQRNDRSPDHKQCPLVSFSSGPVARSNTDMFTKLQAMPSASTDPNGNDFDDLLPVGSPSLKRPRKSSPLVFYLILYC